jgi:hypothetical protein
VALGGGELKQKKKSNGEEAGKQLGALRTHDRLAHAHTSKTSGKKKEATGGRQHGEATRPKHDKEAVRKSRVPSRAGGKKQRGSWRGCCRAESWFFFFFFFFFGAASVMMGLVDLGFYMPCAQVREFGDGD